jgi:hypothetical protein
MVMVATVPFTTTDTFFICVSSLVGLVGLILRNYAIYKVCKLHTFTASTLLPCREDNVLTEEECRLRDLLLRVFVPVCQAR